MFRINEIFKTVDLNFPFTYVCMYVCLYVWNIKYTLQLAKENFI